MKTKLELMEDLQIDGKEDLILLIKKVKYWHGVASELKDRVIIQVFLEPIEKVRVKH